MKFTVCEQTSPPIKSLIEQDYIPWYSNVDNSTEWYTYASGLGSFTLPLICIIDPNDSNNYLNRTTGVQNANDFYARLLSHNPTYPDLVVLSPSVSNTTLTPSQSFIASVTVRNQGNVTSNSSILRYYRSADSTITTGDTQLATVAIASLAPNETSGDSATVIAPTSTGTYWIGACADAISGEHNTGNNCSTGVQVNVTTQQSEKTNIVSILHLLLL